MDPKLRSRRLTLADAEPSVGNPAERLTVEWTQDHSPHD